MASPIHGIHHITAIASDPKQTVDFYTRILGLRLVKKSVNQDDVATYHLFFGDKTGEPGMDLTFFTFQPAFQGVRGLGQVTTISLAVPPGSLSFWQKRFQEQQVEQEATHEMWGQRRLVFYDGDGQRLELVEVDVAAETAQQRAQVWVTSEVKIDHAIRAFHSAKLSMESQLLIEPILVAVFGYQLEAKQQNQSLFKLPNATRAAFLEVEEGPSLEAGLTGAGTVHHIAFRVSDEDAELKMRRALLHLGLYPTEVINRFYFKSVYFRTPAGILFEIATEGPGFTADESEADLGKKLALPPFLENRRVEIEAGLTPI